MYKNFVELLDANPVAGNKKVAAICAHEDHVIEAMIDVNQRYDVQPTLIGHEDEIHMLLAKHNCFKQFRIIQAATDEQAVRIAIDLVKAGDCDVIFKGLIQTGTMMRAIVNHETGICERGVMSHVALMEVPGLHRLLAVTDAALLTYPDVDKKMEEYPEIKLAIHLHGPDIDIYQTAEVIWNKVKDYNPRMGMCLDIGHDLRGGADPVEDLKKYHTRVFDMHFKDESEASKAGWCVEIGRGKIDFPALVRMMRKVGYDGVCSLEYEKDMDDPFMGIAESYGYLKAVCDMA